MDEKRTNAESVNRESAGGTETIQDKLSSAARSLDDARAEARARLAEEKRRRAEAERAERARSAEEEARRREEAERAREALAKKSAEMEYAASFRSRLRDRRGADKGRKKDADSAEISASDRLREERLQREREEIERRNAASDSLLSTVSERARARERAELDRMLAAARLAAGDIEEEKLRTKAVEEAEANAARIDSEAQAEREALEEAEAARRRAEEEAAARKALEEAEAARRKAEEEAAARKAIEEAEAARRRAEEEAAARKALEEAEAARRKAEEEAAARKVIEEAEAARRKAEEEAAARKAIEEAARLQAAQYEESHREFEAARAARHDAEALSADTAPDTIVHNGFTFTRGIPESNGRDGDGVARDIAKDSGAAQGNSPETKSESTEITVIDGIEFVRGIPEEKKSDSMTVSVGDTPSGKVTAADAESTKSAPKSTDSTASNDGKVDTGSTLGKKEGGVSDPLADTIFGSTYSMMTARSGFVRQYEEKRESAEAAIRKTSVKYSETDDAIPTDEGANPFRYDAGYIIRPDTPSPKKAKKSKKEKRGRGDDELVTVITDSDGREDTPIAEEPAVTPVAPSAESVPQPEETPYTPPLRTDARLEALIAEKARLEGIIAELTEKNRREIAALRAESDRARIERINKDYAEREERYRRDIAALSARIREIEARHTDARSYYTEEAYGAPGAYSHSGTYSAPTAYSAYVAYSDSGAYPHPENAYRAPQTYGGVSDKEGSYTPFSDIPSYEDKDGKRPSPKDKKQRKKDKKRGGKRELLEDYREYERRYESDSSDEKSGAPEVTYASSPADSELAGGAYSSEQSRLYGEYAKYFVDEPSRDEDPDARGYHTERSGEPSRAPYNAGSVYSAPSDDGRGEKKNEGYDPYREYLAYEARHGYGDEHPEDEDKMPEARRGYGEPDTDKAGRDEARGAEIGSDEYELYMTADEARRLRREERARSEFAPDAPVEAMKRRELEKHLAKSAHREKKLIKAISRSRKKFKSASATEKPEKMLVTLEVERELYDVYAYNLRTCIASKHKKGKRFFGRSIDSLARDYNRDLERYDTLSGESTPRLDGKPSLYIAEHDTPPTLPCPKAPKAQADRQPARSRQDARREQLMLVRDEDRAERRRKKDEKRGGSKNAVAIVGRQTEHDIETVTERIEYRINKYDYDITKTKFRFGEETGKEKRVRRRLLARLKEMRAARKSVLKDVRESNARYLEIATADAHTARARRGADRERMTEISERMRIILTERDAVNRRLDALYRENEQVFCSAKNTRKRITELKLAESKRAFRARLREYRRVSRYRIPVKEKQPLYDVMNDQIELEAYETELKFRLKHEHPKKEARAAIREQLRETAKKLRYAERDYKRLRKRIERSAKGTASPKRQLGWLVLLIVVVAAAAVGFIFFREQIGAFFDKVIGFITAPFGKS